MRLDRKVAIVTGSGSGLGRAMVMRMAREGASALFLASDESSFITGQLICCDGGRTNRM